MTVTCAVCGRKVRLRKDGTVARHGTLGRVCPQSGSEQRDTSSQGGGAR